MIVSRRAVLALCALAAILAIVAIVDGTRTTPPETRAIAPGFTDAAELRWVRADGTAYTASRAAGDLVDPVVTALRGGRWHRAADVAAAGTVALTLHVAGLPPIGIGQPLGEQHWITRGDDALLVDAWIARALGPAPWQLRDPQPFRELATSAPIVIAGARPQPWIAPERIAALRAALGALEVVGDRTPGGEVAGLALTLGTIRIARDGTCTARPTADAATVPTEQQIALTIGCVDAARWLAVEAAATAVLAPDAADLRLAPIEPTSIRLADDGVLDLPAKREPTISPTDLVPDPPPADIAAVGELLAVLRAPAVVDYPMVVAAKTGQLQLFGPSPVGLTGVQPDTRVVLELHPPDLVVRSGDDRVFRIGTGAFAILARPRIAYRKLALWREEPSTITRVVLDHTTYRRGDVIGEWHREHGPSIAIPKLEMLVLALAAPHPLGVARTFAPDHTGEIEIDVAGSITRHVFDVDTTHGCAIRETDLPIIVDRALCAFP